ncbi:MAG TPA: DUF4870 domain-containing protein [Pontiella sp.]
MDKTDLRDTDNSEPVAVVPSTSERQWAMGCHLIALSGYIIPIATIGAPLVLWLVKRNEGIFIDDQGKEAVNFQISILIYMFISGILIPLFGLGLLLIIVVGIFDLIAIIMASIKASDGIKYRYPLCIRFIK